MSVSGISSSLASLRESFKELRTSGGVSKEDITRLQEEIDDSTIDAGLSEFAGIFDTIDVDGSGKLDESELRTYSRQAGSRPPPPPDGAPRGEPPAMSQSELSQMAEETGDEALTAVASSFDEADTDQDGKVSHTEFMAFVEANGLTPQKPGDSPVVNVAETTEEGTGTAAEATTPTEISSKAFQAILKA